MASTPFVPPLPPMENELVGGSSLTLRRVTAAGITGIAVVVGIAATGGGLLFAFVLLAVVLGGLELARPINRYRLPRPGSLTDAVHFFATGFLGTVGSFAVLVVPYVILRRSGAMSWNPIGALPGWSQLPAALLITEVSGYWGHRLAHTIPWWWRLHAVHHSSTRMDWLAAPRQHPLDRALSEAFRAFPLLVLNVPKGLFGTFVVFAGFQAILIHANIRFRVPLLRHVIATPEFHHWHHALEPDAIDKNFAGEFPWMDRIFGTYHMPDRWPSAYGAIADVPDTGWLEQLTSPFRGTRTMPPPAIDV